VIEPQACINKELVEIEGMEYDVYLAFDKSHLYTVLILFDNTHREAYRRGQRGRE